MHERILVCLVMLTTAGCATLQEEPGLDVTIAGLRFEKATLFETTAVFTVRLLNETPAPIIVDGAVHKIELNGVDIGKGVSDARVEVGRFASVTQEVTVHLRNIALFLRAARILDGDDIAYRMSSTIHTVSEHGRRRVRTHSEGRFALPAAEAAPLRLLQSPAQPVSAGGSAP